MFVSKETDVSIDKVLKQFEVSVKVLKVQANEVEALKGVEASVHSLNT